MENDFALVDKVGKNLGIKDARLLLSTPVGKTLAVLCTVLPNPYTSAELYLACKDLTYEEKSYLVMHNKKQELYEDRGNMNDFTSNAEDKQALSQEYKDFLKQKLTNILFSKVKECSALQAQSSKFIESETFRLLEYIKNIYIETTQKIDLFVAIYADGEKNHLSSTCKELTTYAIETATKYVHEECRKFSNYR